jgi:hypothetical protein
MNRPSDGVPLNRMKILSSLLNREEKKSKVFKAYRFFMVKPLCCCLNTLKDQLGDIFCFAY